MRKAAAAILATALLVALPGPAAGKAPRECTFEALEASAEACDALIAKARDGADKAVMLYRRAWARNERGRAESALADLDAALRLDPDQVAALQERGYTLVELGEFARALPDIDKAAALEPDNPAIFVERAWIRRGTGDFAGAYADRDRAAMLKPGDAGALLDRAEAALWLGRFDEALADWEKAVEATRKETDVGLLARVQSTRDMIRLWSERSADGAPAELCRAAGAAGRFDAEHLVGDCTAAFLAAATPAARAEALTYRALAWLVGRKEAYEAATDREVAVALEPANADWLFNLGYSYYRLERYPAALRLFERSLAVEESAAALAGRAASHYALGDKARAGADARRAAALKPHPLAGLVLGRLAFERGDKAEARAHWLQAWRAGWREDDLAARLKSVGVADPELEAASR